jgi:hypothetical protein
MQVNTKDAQLCATLLQVKTEIFLRIGKGSRDRKMWEYDTDLKIL